MNELIFFFQILAAAGSILGALRLGKSALVALIALQGVLANLFVVKQIALFGLSVTCSDVFAIGAMLSLNLLQEYFGKETAKQAIRISLLLLLFFTLVSQIHLLYIPTPLDTTHTSFSTLLSSSPRLLFSSLATFYLVQQLDLRLFSHLKGPLITRLSLSLLISQLLDTTLFSFLGLYGLVESLFDIILFSFLIKCIIIAASAPLALLSKRFVKHVLPI